MSTDGLENDGTLASVWVQLRPLETGQLNVHAGFLAHAAFLDLLHQVDPALAQVLHDLNHRKPFTLSSLVEIEPETGYRTADRTVLLQPRRLYGLRLTSLASYVLNTFTARFFNLDASSLRVRLGSQQFQVVRIEGSPGNGGAWLGRASFATLAALAPARAWTFRFASPTAFSLGEQEWGGRKFGLFPEPGQVFDSLAGCWNDFAPAALARIDKPALREYVEKYVAVAGMKDLHTEMLEFKQHRQLGFVGEVSYRLLEKQPAPEMATILNQLAALALYAGVGYKTTMGMGQARCIATEALPDLTEVKARATVRV